MSKPDYKSLRKEQKDFFMKYTALLKRFSLKNMKKIYNHLPWKDDDEIIEMLSIDDIMEEYDSKIKAIREGSATISKIGESTKEYNRVDLVKRTMKLVRYEIHKELINFYHGDAKMDKLAKENPKSYEVYQRYKTLIELQEDKIKAMMNFAKDGYRKMAKFLKKEGT